LTLSVPRTNTNIVWLRGHTSILQVCRQIYEECIDLLYGSNIFEIDIKYDGIRFRYTWLIPSSLKPKMLYPFPDHFSTRNLQLIRNYVINVEHVDSYQGMIKYNCGGPGLTAGVRNQVQSFVNEIRDVESLRRVAVRLSDGSKMLSDIRRVKVHCMERGKNTLTMQTVLNPFFLLRGVSSAKVSGSVSSEYTAQLERAMTTRRSESDDATYPVTRSDINMDPAVLWRWKHVWNA